MTYIENGNINVCCMAHNAHWAPLEIMSKNTPNLNIDIYGDSPNYLLMRNFYEYHYKDYQEWGEANDYDLIILDSSYPYTKEILDILENLALTMSKNNNKRVTIAYQYVVPIEEKTKDCDSMVIIESCNDELDYYENINIEKALYFTNIDLLELTLEKHLKKLENDYSNTLNR